VPTAHLIKQKKESARTFEIIHSEKKKMKKMGMIGNETLSSDPIKLWKF
jgi:hypothetical protein